MDPSHARALYKSPLFASLTDDDFAILIPALERRDLDPGEELFREGYRGDTLAVILEGSFAVRINHPTFGNSVIKTLQPGESVGEMSCIDPAPRSASVVAEGPASALLLTQSLLRDLRARAPEIAAAIVGGVIEHVTGRLRHTDDRIEAVIQELHVHSRLRAPTRPGRFHAGRQEPERLREVGDLSHLPPLQRLTPQDLVRLAAAEGAHRYPPGTDFCREGEPGHHCFLLLDGRVDVVRTVPGGEQVLAVLEPGTLMGQMALVDHSPRSATLRAKGAVEAVRIDQTTFRRLVEDASPLALRFQEEIAVSGIRQLRLANERLANLLERIEERRVLRAAAEADPPEEEEGEDPAGELLYTQTALREWGLSLEAELDIDLDEE